MRTLWRFWLISVLSFSAVAQTGNPTAVTGTWEGASVCTVRPSSCHDEHVIYDITQGANQKLKMSADKVVSGERQNMGDLECTYADKTLRCPFPRGVWSFTVSGMKMSGTLKLTDGTVFRKVEVSRKGRGTGK